MATYTSFDKRSVRYEELHDEKPEYFAAMVEAAEICDQYRVLDCGCGYGACAREILVRRNSGYRLAFDLVDESEVQLGRARKELAALSGLPDVNLEFLHATFPDDFIRGVFPDGFWLRNRYDAIVAKMVLHEVPSDRQLRFMEALHESLKPGKILVLWDLCLEPDTRDFFQDVVLRKDLLAGFETMVTRRNFLSLEALIGLFDRSGFTDVRQVKPIVYQVDTRKRLLPEFSGDESLLAAWHDFVRARARSLPADVLHRIDYRDQGDRICFRVNKGIFRGCK